MQRRRTLAILVLALGLIYLAVGMFSLYHYREVLQIFAYYGVPDEVQMSNPDIAQTRGKLWNAFLEFPLVGVMVLIAGLGLYLAKEWARKLWLALVLLLWVMHVARLAMDYRVSDLIFVERVAEVVLIVALAALSWFWLRRKSIKAESRSNEPAPT